MAEPTNPGEGRTNFLIYRKGPDGKYEAPEGPNGLFVEVFDDETLKPLIDSGDIALNRRPAGESFTLSIANRVAADVVRVLTEKRISFQNRSDLSGHEF